MKPIRGAVYLVEAPTRIGVHLDNDIIMNVHVKWGKVKNADKVKVGTKGVVKSNGMDYTFMPDGAVLVLKFKPKLRLLST